MSFSSGRRTAWFAVVTAGCLLLAACSGGASGGASPSTPGATPSGSTARDVAALAPGSVWSHVLDGVQPDGQVSLATALAAFATAIGPVPGAVVPSGMSAPVESGTLAVVWVRSHWGQLSAVQRRAVLTDLGTTLARPPSSGSAQGDVVPADLTLGRAAKAPRAADPNLDCATSDSPGAGPYRAQVDEITSEIGARIGVPFTIPVYLELNTHNVTKTGAKDESLAYTLACDRAQYVPGVINGCVIHFEPRLVSDGDFSDGDVHAVLIHELMHCFLYQQFGVRYDKMPAWYVEGVPEWVKSDLAGGDAVADSWWLGYLDTDSLPLFKRTYDAMGFYTHLADVGTDPWTVILPIGQAFIASGYSNLAGWKAAGVNQDFLDSWGSGYAQGRYPGTAWATGANLPHYQPNLGPVEPVTDTTVRNIGASADSANLRQLAIDAQIIEITTSAGANGRISLGGGNDTTLDHTAGVNYCSVASGCVCPSTSPQAHAKFTHIDSGVEYASISGDTSTATMTLTGMSLATFCANSCPVGSATGGVVPAGTYDGIVNTTVITEMDEDGLVTAKGINRVRGPVHLVSNGTTVQGYMRTSGGIGVSVHVPVGGTSKSYATHAVGTISGPASSPIVVVTSGGYSSPPVGLHLTQVSCAGITGDMAAVFREYVADLGPAMAQVRVVGTATWKATRD